MCIFTWISINLEFQVVISTSSVLLTIKIKCVKLQRAITPKLCKGVVVLRDCIFRYAIYQDNACNTFIRVMPNTKFEYKITGCGYESLLLNINNAEIFERQNIYMYSTSMLFLAFWFESFEDFTPMHDLGFLRRKEYCVVDKNQDQTCYCHHQG
jgi:hypothetical protein